ncbi:MAG: indole-3-glycerol-phosphate synthase [Chromatiales bacterium 21-64-14]|nr:MAG: indole-3-glycerol-phosphate synthase [Chromatiales bacterium 21-64-14]HQU14477.1 indole-3-glycerol phosphate synthase TrpC [Gammaproteobacteria bacterium]
MKHYPSPVADILDRILRRKAEEVAARRQALGIGELRRQAEGAPPTRGFAARLRQVVAAGDAAVIAEIKRASPSKGVLREVFEPERIAESYARGGATCLSVLTDREFFLGDDTHLARARSACGLPVLRKDFVIDPYQIYESRVLGADCILLIVAALGDSQLREYCDLAQGLHMDVLVEVHDGVELDRALVVDAPVVGINNRNLRTFETDLATTLMLRERVPPDRLLVTESGVQNRDDVARLRSHGVCSFLVGEAFMRAPDPGARLAELFA